MSISDIDIATDPAKSVNIWEKVLDGKSMTFEGRHRRKDGTTFPVEVKISSFSLGKDPLIFGFARDISDRERHTKEREKLQTQLSQAQKMEALGALAGGIAHDFNNLLMGVMGRSSLLAPDLTGAHAQLEHIQGIDACVKSAMNLTKQLLGLARGGKYEVETTDAIRLTCDTLDMFSRTKKEIRVHTTFDPDLDAVTVDKAQIGQVLLNIFINAWQAMPGGGTISLQTENRTVDEMQIAPFQVAAGRYVRITVTDTGIGMASEVMQRIFDPFFTTKEKGRGTGLGLASAYGIVKNHGGFITVDSTVGQGSVFSIFLPASDKQLPQVAGEPGEMAIGEGVVLLVDDESVSLDVGQQMLERLGYTVLTASGGQKALDVFQREAAEIRLVILDMIMPGMGGGETFDRLRAIDPSVRVVLCSGYSINGQATDILERGCNGFLQKPFSLVDLSAKIKEILS